MPLSAEQLKKAKSRVDEDYLITQYEHATNHETHRQHKARIADWKRVYRGDWLHSMPDGSTRTVKPLIENQAKRALHDISGLAKGAKSSIRFIPESDAESAEIAAEVRGSIADTHWEVGRGRKQEKQLYMDLVSPAGFAALACGFKKSETDYPTFTRLDPENAYPDVRNGKLTSLVYVEEIKVRAAQHLFEGKLDNVPPNAQETGSLTEYYDDKEVVRGFVYKVKNETTGAVSNSGVILDRWEHKLGRVPVAFVAMESGDGAFRGLLDQVEGGLTAKNDIVQFLMDYIESMVHAPFEERGVMNAEDLPGPDTIYHHDQTLSGDTFMRRVAPASPAGAVFGLLGLLQNEIQGESIQPPARQGQVQQSIASGSFVNSTQGQLTTVVEDLQDQMVDLRQQATYIGLKIDEEWLDKAKPMIRPVGKKRSYTPSKDINGYHFCIVQFGAMQGITKLDADVRVMNHKGAGFISDETARAQIDYLDDPTSEQDRIDKETMAASFLQRIATDPNIPPYIIAQIMIQQSEGMNLIDAIKAVAPDLVNLPAAQPAGAPAPQQGIPAPQPGEPAGEPTSPVQGQVPGGGSAEPDLSKLIAPKPAQQLIVRNPY